MALKTCPDCGIDLSKKAATCPKCGAPQKKSTSLFTWLVIVVLGVWVIGAMTTPEVKPLGDESEASHLSRFDDQASPSLFSSRIDKSAEAQKKRKDLIDRLIERGLFEKIEMPGSLPRLWIKSAFYALEFDAKESFVSVVYAYYFDGNDLTDSILIFDSKTGKEVGSYSSENPGLRLY